MHVHDAGRAEQRENVRIGEVFRAWLRHRSHLCMRVAPAGQDEAGPWVLAFDLDEPAMPTVLPGTEVSLGPVRIIDGATAQIIESTATAWEWCSGMLDDSRCGGIIATGERRELVVWDLSESQRGRICRVDLASGELRREAVPDVFLFTRSWTLADCASDEPQHLWAPAGQAKG